LANIYLKAGYKVGALGNELVYQAADEPLARFCFRAIASS